jgi:hypothetical protein
MLHLLTKEKTERDCAFAELESIYNVDYSTVDKSFRVIRELKIRDVSEEVTFCRKRGYLVDCVMRSTYVHNTNSHINNSSSNLRRYVAFVHIGEQGEVKNMYFEYEITDGDNFNFQEFLQDNEHITSGECIC